MNFYTVRTLAGRYVADARTLKLLPPSAVTSFAAARMTEDDAEDCIERLSARGIKAEAFSASVEPYRRCYTPLEAQRSLAGQQQHREPTPDAAPKRQRRRAAV